MWPFSSGLTPEQDARLKRIELMFLAQANAVQHIGQVVDAMAAGDTQLDQLEGLRTKLRQATGRLATALAANQTFSPGPL